MSKQPITIERLLIMGDSLSDEGEMNQRRLLGMIPMKGLSGLTKSPEGRFTNGFTWSDQLLVMLANDFTIQQLNAVINEPLIPRQASQNVDALVDMPIHKADATREGNTINRSADISDGVIDGDLAVKSLVEQSYSLDLKLKQNNLRFTYQGQVLARSYAQGGLTAHDYAGASSWSISRFFSRLILESLRKKRQQVLLDDIASGITTDEKQKTLVVEWSGANDLITVNKRPSRAEVDKAITARIENAKALIAKGYQHLVLFNLPNLGLTPRFQSKGGKEQQNAAECSIYFNEELQKQCEQLAKDNPTCSIEVFDVASTFNEVYENPLKYGFDPVKQRQPFSTSKDFKITKAHTSPEKGYMFWDDVHPIMYLQSIMAQKFYEKYSKEYKFNKPRVMPLREVSEATKKMTATQLLALFNEAYQKELQADKSGYFGFFRRSRLPQPSDDLAKVLQHALYNGGNRSFKVMMDLGWFDKEKHLIPDIPVLVEALEQASAAQVGEVRRPK
jgi:hypothetical protein